MLLDALTTEAAKKRSAERLQICSSCEMFNAENSKCNKCGCYMKVKTLLESAKCPLKKWV